MVETLVELLDLIRREQLREHRHPNVQLKSSWKQEDGRQISGRANDLKHPSSWMVIGVEDDGAVSKRSEDWAKAHEELVSNHLNQYLDPPQACTHLQCHKLNEYIVIVIGISNPGSVTRWNGKAYKSSGTTSLEMSPEEAMELTIRLPGLQDYSAQPWVGSVDTANVQTFCRRLGTSERPLTTEHASASFRGLEQLGLQNRVAARILFGDVTCRLVVYDIADNVVVNKKLGPLSILVTDDFQDSLSSIGRSRPSPHLLWPRLALSEGLANAVAHSAYFENNGEIIIEVHPKWLCISNLCIRSAAAFANKWFSRSHQSTNVLLMETLRLGKYVDELGRGKQLILREFLTSGLSPPYVVIEPAGRLSRWRLYLPTGDSNPRIIRLLDRLKTNYAGDERRSLLALALCLWRNKPLNEIVKCTDVDTEKAIYSILDDMNGPVFLHDSNELVLVRWARLILDEGLDSKQLSPGEEERLFAFAMLMQTRYDSGAITPKRLRELGQMAESKSEQTLSSNILKRWEAIGRVQRVGRGMFRFVMPDQAPEAGIASPAD